MVKLIYVAGVPCSGKTTISFHLSERLLGYEDGFIDMDVVEFKHGKCRGIESRDGKYKMLGVFDTGDFCGTDRLSMTVIDDAIAYIKQLNAKPERYFVFAEGDRLFNARFLSETNATLLVIDANKVVLQKRHAERGDTQSNVFLKRCRTKVENFIAKYRCMRIWNNTDEDSERILNFIVKTAQEYVDGV